MQGPIRPGLLGFPGHRCRAIRASRIGLNGPLEDSGPTMAGHWPLVRTCG